MATIYQRKAEMRAAFIQKAPEGAGFRFKTNGSGEIFLQLKDSSSDQFRSAFTTNGALQAGPNEE